jgi:hypothetical protein
MEKSGYDQHKKAKFNEQTGIGIRVFGGGGEEENQAALWASGAFIPVF